MQNFKRLTEQEKREIGDNTVSLYETFAVLRERLATAVLIALSLVPPSLAKEVFRAAKESTKKTASEASHNA